MSFKDHAADVAKEITIAFADKLSSDATRSDENLADLVTSFYEKVYDTAYTKLLKG